MKSFSSLYLVSLLLFLPVCVEADESKPNEELLLVLPEIETSRDIIKAPEPNTALLAGIGGLVLLFVALRRK